MEQLDFIISKIDRIEAKMDKTDTKLDDILVQATKTNGRVTQLEKTTDVIEGDVFKLNEFKNQSQGRERGVVMVSTFLGAIIGFIVQYFLSKK